MERYRYYGKGRYFAVTNKYPHTSELSNIAIGNGDYLGKLGNIGSEVLGNSRFADYDYEVPGNEMPNFEAEGEPYGLATKVDDDVVLAGKNEGEWSYDEGGKKSYDIQEQSREDVADDIPEVEPQADRYRTDGEPRVGEKYEQLSDEYKVTDNYENNDFPQSDSNYQWPEPPVCHDAYDDAYDDDSFEKDRVHESRKAKYTGKGRDVVNDDNTVWTKAELEQQEQENLIAYDGNYEEFKQNGEQRGNDSDHVMKHNEFPRSDESGFGKIDQWREARKSKEERPYNVVNRYESKFPEKNLYSREVARHEEQRERRDIDKKSPYYQTRENDNLNKWKQGKDIGEQKKPSTEKQLEVPSYRGGYRGGHSVVDVNKNIRKYEDHSKDKGSSPSLTTYERYNGYKQKPIRDNKFIKENEEAKRVKSIEQQFPKYDGYDHLGRNRELDNNLVNHKENLEDKPQSFEQYTEKLIETHESTRDGHEPQRLSNYGDNHKHDFEIDIDEVYESEKEEKVDIQNDSVVSEEPIHEEFHEIQSEPIALEVLEDDDEDYNEDDEGSGEGQWPPPPEDNAKEKIEIRPGYDTTEEYVHEHMNRSVIKEDGSLYTSFLTIDVTPGKRESLDAPSLIDSKHRSSLLNLVTGNHELESTDENLELDKDDMDKIRHDIEMISKYLHNMPLGASHWPHNYDVLRDLVKLYLASKNTSTAALNYLLDYFLKLDWPGIFLKCSRKIMKSYPQVFVHSSDQKIPFEDPTPETLDMTQVSIEYAVAVIFQVILSLAAEFTEIHQQSKNDGYKGYVKFIFQELLPKLHGIPWGQSTAREEFLHSSIDILYNYSQSTTNIGSFYECNATDVLINLRRETDFIGGNRVNIGALLTLSFLIDDRNNHIIFTDSAPISLLIHYVEESLSKIDHCYADFSLAELIDGLTRIASHDQNKLAICSHGGINVIKRVLTKSKDEEELSAVCRLIWSLCFVEKCKHKITKRSPEIVEIIRDLQRSKNLTLQQLAESLIWEFEEKYSDSGQSVKSEVAHILISYHAENREKILEISDRLKEKGYKVWLEKSKGDSYPKHLVEAVQNAAIVLVAVSRKYKQSPSVFAEGDYAFKLCKPMIPITLERNYKPDGWLGMLVGSKVWLDLTQESKFEGHMQMLMRQIGNKGKGERAINILYIDDKQRISEDIADKSENRLIDISRWGNEEVMEWLQQNNLRSCVPEEKLQKLRGPHLLQLHHLRRESPDFYYNSLEPQLGFTDVIDMMEFTQALESLTELL